MDAETQRAVAEALDVSIADVARKDLDRLKEGKDSKLVARLIHRSLDSLSKLQQGNMPSYDAWDAPFYAVWYQPAQINLAYTLIRQIPRNVNPVLVGDGALQVHDFGCGELATQFGLAFAAADTLREQGSVCDIVISSRDSSNSMQTFGQLLWQRFVNEIADSTKYPELDALNQVCATMAFDDGLRHYATQWLTVLHVAYAENAEEVKRTLESRITNKIRKTSLILVTAHPGSVVSAYRPVQGYLDYDRGVMRGQNLLLREGDFGKTTVLRSDLANEEIGSGPVFLGPEEHRFTYNYLTRYPTGWYTQPDFRARWTVYTRR